MDNKLLGLAVLGIGGFVIYTMMKKRDAEEEAALLSTPLPIVDPKEPEEVAIAYGEAITDWNQRLAGETLPNGDKIFQPLDISAENPLRLYYAIVKKRSFDGAMPLGENISRTIGEIYLYNTVTKREVRIDELARQATMTTDAKLATEETFGNAFVEACKINPQYLPWTHQISTGSVKTGGRITDNNREYHRAHCGDKYNMGL